MMKRKHRVNAGQGVAKSLGSALAVGTNAHIRIIAGQGLAVGHGLVSGVGAVIGGTGSQVGQSIGILLGLTKAK